MKNYLVKDLMVPISEYATVTIGTSLLDAVRVLEQAQEAYTVSKYQHRAILVLDENGQVVGKISQLRALKAIEGDHAFNDEIEEMRRFNFSEAYIAQLRDKFRSRKIIIEEQTLREAAVKKVEEFMQAPTPGEFVPRTAVSTPPSISWLPARTCRSWSPATRKSSAFSGSPMSLPRFSMRWRHLE